jgi:hypothetical protein
MAARSSPDGKTVELNSLDLFNGNQYMYHAVFTIIDANHHAENWTYMMPGDKPLRAHLDPKRAQVEQLVPDTNGLSSRYRQTSATS